MATVIEELVSRLGFEIDDKKLDTFNKKSEKLKANLKRISIIASTAAVGIAAWVSKVGIATDANVKFADSIGITFAALQELQFATEIEGGSLQSLQSSLLAVSQRVSEAARGLGSGVEIFGLLGISVRDANGELKTSDILLEEIADEFQRFDKLQQIEFASKLGLSPDLLLLMQKGSENLRNLRIEAKNYGLVTEETARNAEEFQDGFTKIRRVVGALFTNIAGGLMPTVTELADKFREFVEINKKIISQNITKAVKILTTSVLFLVKNLKILLVIVGSIFALKILGFIGSFTIAVYSLITAIIGLNANLTITNILMAGLPLLIGLAIAASLGLLLIWQDLAVAQRGGKSVFGDALEGGGLLGVSLKAILVIAKGIGAVVESTMIVFTDAEKGLADLIDTAILFGTAIKNHIVIHFENVLLNLKKIKRFFNEGGGFFGDPQGISASNIPFLGDKRVIDNSKTTITAPITIQSESGDPLSIAEAVAEVFNDIARNGINSSPVVVVR